MGFKVTSMIAVKQETVQGQRRRGRPRTHELAPGLARRNLLIDSQALEELRTLYGAKSDSEAVRRAIDLALLAAAGEIVRDEFAKRGGPVDVYGPPPSLPVYLQPGDVPDELLVDDDFAG